MKTSSFPAIPVLLAALGALGCASSDWAKTESVPGGRLYVPRVYAPLLPGSMYPDRKVALPAKDRPALVVVCPKAGDCRKQEILDRAAQRGLIVLLGKDPKDDLLRTRPEVRAERIGWLLVRPEEEFLRRWMEARAPGNATAILGPARRAAGPVPHVLSSPSSPSRKIFLGALLGEEPLETADGTVLKLYSPNEKGLLPSEAFRDAVEWLALELGAP